uniref:Ribosomal protein S10 n=26 Tax=Peronospora TaxID=70742 RepID=A0A0D5MF19_9STRA|nr:40S ribosomal protein S10 [Peronospora minor]AJY58496.1 40S ribosomal protein S10 [Peronospora atriplicis-hastatae]AJY58499.1 40S ribosomal protein S10 [Peronospora schachtii]AJY58513.1 40S ribosomal protein S10 [Peronospora polycarpi]AJY58514.1 40S ribosomal protein S10 [Peronospora sp. S27]AJY58515.1 40S ribosomal protein S10 [Peronospora sp. BP124]AJY58516.1 40S ribosomal protein S10 [Peronospora sp. 1029]AJY58519.1 40S ribosomal protein S10 [Peronospora sp. 1031]AJY58520.1 40S riboso
MYILRITFKSFQKINQLKQKLIKLKTFNKLKNIKIKGIFQIKNKNKIFTLLKSPHVNKKSREHFIYKNYLPKIDIKFKNIFQLFNFLILIKKFLSENSLMNIKIIKKN